eukprot:SAG31_NODE_3527_length_4155_cov_2.415927_2_plen_273_part_00
MFSLWTQPQLVDAFIRASLELNALSELVVGLATAPRAIFLLHSPSAAMMGDTVYVQQQLAVYSLVAQLGVNVGFVSGSVSNLTTTCASDSPCALLVPCMIAISEQVVAELQLGVAGVYAITVGNASVCKAAWQYDDQGHSLAPKHRQTMRAIQTVDYGPVAGASALAQLESKLRRSLRKRLVLCGRTSNATSTHFGVHCRSAMVVGRLGLLVTNLLNHSVTVSLRLNLVGSPNDGMATLAPSGFVFAQNGTKASTDGQLELGSLETVSLWRV